MDKYFDYAASAPAFPEALEEFNRVSRELFGNPSSLHFYGQQALEHLGHLKKEFLNLVNWGKGKLILTSGGTEGNNLVIRGILEGYQGKKMALPYDVHSSQWFAADLYEDRVQLITTETDGSLSLSKIEKALSKDTILLSMTHICNETGVLHDLEGIAKLCADRKVFLHVDGAQAVGHIPLNFSNLPVHFYTFGAHKFGGPRGVGGLLTRGDELISQICGGGQEGDLRSGTENLAGLAASAKALELSISILPQETSRLRSLSQILIEELSNENLNFKINSDLEKGLPGLLSLSFGGISASSVVTEMSLRGFGISTGSACYAGQVEPSRMILGMKRTMAEALGTLRISMGRHTSEEAVRELAAVLREIIKKHRLLR